MRFAMSTIRQGIPVARMHPPRDCAPVPTENPICSRAPAYKATNQKFDPDFDRNKWKNTRNPPVRLVNQQEVIARAGQPESTRSSAGIAARTVSFKLRVARSGGEDRRLAVWQRRLQVPPGTRDAVPVRPWPARGPSRIL